MGLDSPMLHMADNEILDRVTTETTTVIKEFDKRGRVVKETTETVVTTDHYRVGPTTPYWYGAGTTTINATTVPQQVKYGLSKAED